MENEEVYLLLKYFKLRTHEFKEISNFFKSPDGTRKDIMTMRHYGPRFIFK